MPFVLCREDALRDVAAAARFCTRVPRGPPDHAEIHKQRDRRHPRRIEFREERESRAGASGRIHRTDLRLHGIDSTDGITARMASTITIPIFSANWNRSVTRTPHRPEIAV